jgi:hypothetical protein
MGTDGNLHVRFHMNTQALGTSDQSNNPNSRPKFDYNGSQEQDSQDFVVDNSVGSTSRYHAEWNLKIMAKGNGGVLSPDDDFYLHMLMDSPVDVTQAVISSSGYCR